MKLTSINVAYIFKIIIQNVIFSKTYKQVAYGLGHKNCEVALLFNAEAPKKMASLVQLAANG